MNRANYLLKIWNTGEQRMKLFSNLDADKSISVGGHSSERTLLYMKIGFLRRR